MRETSPYLAPAYLGRAATNRSRRLLRRATAPIRALPDFLIIGAQRSGTTSLYHYLLQHPRVAMSEPKEVHFFDNQFPRGVAWYRSHFPRNSSGDNHVVVGEASPYYLIHPHAPERAARVLPSVKLICLIRDPVERAISHYFHEVARGTEPLPIGEAMDLEDQRIAHEWQRMLNDPSHVSSSHQSFSYKQRGVYIDQIERWRAAFGPDQLLVVQSEDLFDTTDSVLGDVLGFLGLDHTIGSVDTAARNARSTSGSVPASVRTALREHFAPANARLYDYLGNDLGWTI